MGLLDFFRGKKEEPIKVVAQPKPVVPETKTFSEWVEEVNKPKPIYRCTSCGLESSTPLTGYFGLCDDCGTVLMVACCIC